MIYVYVFHCCRYKLFASVCDVDVYTIVVKVARVNQSLIAMLMGPTWSPSGADRTQMGPMLAPWTLLSGMIYTAIMHTTPRVLLFLFWFSTTPYTPRYFTGNRKSNNCLNITEATLTNIDKYMTRTRHVLICNKYNTNHDQTAYICEIKRKIIIRLGVTCRIAPVPHTYHRYAMTEISMNSTSLYETN